MLTSGINFINFKIKKNSLRVRKNLNSILKNKNQVLASLSRNYKDSYIKKNLNKYKKFKDFRIIGMGGSSLGTQAIYAFLKKKVKTNFIFFDNLQNNQKPQNLNLQ